MTVLPGSPAPAGLAPTGLVSTGFALCERDFAPSVIDALWTDLRRDAVEAAEQDGLMSQPIAEAILRHASLAEVLAQRLARKLADGELPAPVLTPVLGEVFAFNPGVLQAAAFDLLAVRERDPATPDLLTPVMHYKGFLSLQAYRVAHALLRRGRRQIARHLQARSSEVFGVDIHPGARLGCGIMIDHGTGVVIGETAVVEDDVSILQEVTLGGTGKECGDRHPKIRRGVLLGAGAKVLGNIEVGAGAKVGAGSIVLENVPPHTTVVGVPARPVGAPVIGTPAFTMDQMLPAPDYAI